MKRASVVADDEFVKLWNSGMSSEDMAAQYGVTSAVVRNCARRAKLKKRKPVLIVDEKELRQLYATGASVIKIATQLGCDRSTVREAVKRIGLPQRETTFDPHAMDRDLVIEGWFSAMMRADLVRTLGIKDSQLDELRKGLHLPSRNGFRAKSPEAMQAMRCAYLADCDARKEAAAQEQPAPSVPVVSGPPFWTPERDAEVFATGGRYAALRAAARGLGKPVRYVQARWHLLKVAA